MRDKEIKDEGGEKEEEGEEDCGSVVLVD